MESRSLVRLAPAQHTYCASARISVIAQPPAESHQEVVG